MKEKHVDYAFIELPGGIERFKVPALRSGGLDTIQSLSILTSACILLRKHPEDFMVVKTEMFNGAEKLFEKARIVLQKVDHLRLTPRLTRREKEVLAGILAGKVNKEIGRNLNLSERTVKFHVSSLLSKFGVHGRNELTALQTMNKDVFDFEIKKLCSAVEEEVTQGEER